MKLDLKFAELHNPLFLSGTNLQTKLDTKRRTNLRLQYDTVEKELHVIMGDKVAIIPTAAVASMEPINPLDYGIDINQKPQEAEAFKALESFAQPSPPKGKIKAQIQDPTKDVQNKR